MMLVGAYSVSRCFYLDHLFLRYLIDLVLRTITPFILILTGTTLRLLTGADHRRQSIVS